MCVRLYGIEKREVGFYVGRRIATEFVWKWPFIIVGDTSHSVESASELKPKYLVIVSLEFADLSE
jgi:hypothetical protein